MNFSNLKNLSAPYKVAMGVLAVLVLAGVGAYVYQFMGGLGVTGMSNGTSWGLYIASFMFFVGLSAGGLIVASSASIFHVAEYKKVALPAILVSLICICIAGAFVLIDLGGIVRILNLFASPNFMSPLLWDICVITTYLIINLIYLYFMTSKKPGAQNKVAIVSRFALPVAILVHSVTAWIFGLQIARAGWYSTIMAPLFVASAMDSGLALLLLALLWMNRAKVFATSRKLIANLAGLLAVCIAVDGYMVGCEILTMAYPGTEHGMAELGQLFAGATAPFFWIEIIAGVIVPFCILVFAKNRRRTGLVALACAGVVVGVFCKRIWLLFTSFIFPNVSGAPGLISGSSSSQGAAGIDGWAVASSYAPTLPEIMIAVGMVALGVLAFLVLTKVFLTYDPAPALADDVAAGLAPAVPTVGGAPVGGASAGGASVERAPHADAC
ncbi:NrfD/PsrC family molybdoenzyme membrane anchor subunit [Gordonibacter urolithinfaciens]|nr:NrfD/PsrC family molybdoenzyme membrane anchor subunit [Gordonibacter urolithinfaciens]